MSENKQSEGYEVFTCQHCAEDYSKKDFTTIVDPEMAYCPKCYAEYLDDVAEEYGLKEATCGSSEPEHKCSDCDRFGYAMGEPQCFGNWYSSNTSPEFKACGDFKPKVGE